MNFEIRKIDYSKLKGKSVAVVYDGFAGLRFADILEKIIDIDVETYRVNFDEDFCIANAVIRELNHDENIVIIVIVADETAEILVNPDKRYSFVKPPTIGVDSVISQMDLERKFNIINIDGIVRRLEQLI